MARPGDIGFGAFPSTHAALTTAGLPVLGLYFPRARIASGLGVIAIDAGLVAGGWHFIGDVLAGNIVGFTIAVLGYGTVTTLKARLQPWMRVT